MAARPLVLPEPFSGQGSWDQWITHFENVAAVNEWDDATKLLWLRVRLTNRAQTAYEKFPEAAKGDYQESKRALQERFEPRSKRELYQSEFQTRRKNKTEGWADYAEDLKVLVDKAFPNLQEEAREQLALNHFLGQLDNPQIAFAVKQSRPRNLDEAVTATLEMESYAPSRPTRVNRVSVEDEDLSVSAVHGDKSTTESLVSMMQQMMQRMDKIERELTTRTQQPEPHRRELEGTEHKRSSVVCRRCGKRGHYARDCYSKQSSQQQGN